MLQDLKAFLLRGNILDLAVAVVVGAAFGSIVTSFVNDILMPPIGLALGRVDFTNLFVSLSGQAFPSLAAAKAAGAPTLNYGVFINTVLNFAIIGIAVFLVLRAVTRFTASPPPPPAPATTRECPQCTSLISLRARRCPHCTSDVSATPITA